MYLNIVELADSFGVEESVIQDWIRREALPHVVDRGRLLFDRTQVIAWASQRGHAARAGFLAAQHAARGSVPRAETLLRLGGFWRDVPAADVPVVLEQIIARLPGATPTVRQLLTGRLRASDGISWAPVGEGFALPHLRLPVALGREGGICALLFLREPLAQRAPDNVPIVRLLFFIAPSPRAHLELLGEISTAVLRGPLKRLVLAGAPDHEILAALSSSRPASPPPEVRP